MKSIALFLFMILLSPYIQTSFAQKDTIILNPTWTCPATPRIGNQPPYPALDPNGNRLLVHAVDKSGRDVEVWCINDDHFELRVSSPQGSKKLSDCVLINGNNYWAVNASNHFPRNPDGTARIALGPANYTQGGTMVINLDDIIFANHTNWVRPVHRIITDQNGNLVENTDGNRDVHTYYDFRTGNAFQRNTTNHVENGRVIIDTYTPWRQITLSNWEPSRTGYTYSVSFNPVFAQSNTCENVLDQNYADFFPNSSVLLISDVPDQLDWKMILLLAVITIAAILVVRFMKKRQ